MNRRNMMLMTGMGMLAAAMPAPAAGAYPLAPNAPAERVPLPTAPQPSGQTPTYLFHDEFDGPAGSAPDPSKWTIARARELIKNPVFWDRPENMGQYRDDRRNVSWTASPISSSAQRTRTASTSAARFRAPGGEASAQPGNPG